MRRPQHIFTFFDLPFDFATGVLRLVVRSGAGFPSTPDWFVHGRLCHVRGLLPSAAACWRANMAPGAPLGQLAPLRVLFDVSHQLLWSSVPQ